MTRSGGVQIVGYSKKLEGFRLQADLRVESDERLAIVGPSGSGKTTLLRWISGLDPADAGALRIGEFDVTRQPPEMRGVGYVFQDQALFTMKSVLENATFGLRMKNTSRRDAEKQVQPWLERFGLVRTLNTPIDRLSGGERQRLALVRAVAWAPRVLLLDEPFSALDAPLRAKLREEVRALHDDLRIPLILVTHDEEDLRALATGRAEFVGQETRVLTRTS